MDWNLPAVKQFHVTKQRGILKTPASCHVWACVPVSFFSLSSNLICKRLSLEDKRRKNQLYPEVGFSKMKASVPCQRLPHGRKTELWRHLCSWLTVADLRVYCNCSAANMIWLLLLSADLLTMKRGSLDSWIKIRYSSTILTPFPFWKGGIFLVQRVW